MSSATTIITLCLFTKKLEQNIDTGETILRFFSEKLYCANFNYWETKLCLLLGNLIKIEIQHHVFQSEAWKQLEIMWNWNRYEKICTWKPKGKNFSMHADKAQSWTWTMGPKNLLLHIYLNTYLLCFWNFLLYFENI